MSPLLRRGEQNCPCRAWSGGAWLILEEVAPEDLAGGLAGVVAELSRVDTLEKDRLHD
ncbi:hypothetical protein SAMN00790413_05169 [Deinococcus hopiensis KR-140]|uniref:Uncharacterized protein n=1 Tax=Deinococcus hopiensis KR-140 TaxID=695939 RepID=A0A1W1UTX8_9DEIO|nr:hypothetical protein SAMN00790413_05169 [Deinococcus hopiensis KR-140]